MAEIWLKIKEILAQIWYYFTIIFALIGQFFEKLELDFLQKLFYFLSIIILVIGLFNLLKTKKVSNNKIKSKAEKTIQVAENPIANAEVLVEQVKEGIKGVKKLKEKLKTVGKWVYANKISLIDILLSMVAILFAAYIGAENYLLKVEFFAAHSYVAYAIAGVVALVVLGLCIYGIVNHYGLEGVKAFADRLAAKKAEIAAKLTKEQRAELKAKLAAFEKGKKDLEEKLVKNDVRIKELLVLVQNGLATPEQANESNQLNNECQNIKNALANYNVKIGEVKGKLE